MMFHRADRSLTVLALGACLVTSGVTLSGCDRTPPTPPTVQQTPASPAAVPVFEVRGEIKKLPAADGADHSIYLKHEAIPDFPDSSGKKVGMKSMTMPFTLDKSVSLDGLAAGDKVAFTLSVNWPANEIKITKMTKLPEGTQLKFTPMPSGMNMTPASTQP